jgi:hypothetical protein
MQKRRVAVNDQMQSNYVYFCTEPAGRTKDLMRLLIKPFVFLLLLPVCALAQDDDNWPSLSYLRNDYKEVAVVLHVRVERAEISGRIGGYENWRISAVVFESFKGRFKRGDVIEYFHGAEAGFKQEWFMGEKIVFLLAERDKDQKILYSVLENSTLPYTKDRIQKLRSIKRSSAKRPRR